MAYSILKSASCVPEEVELLREVERLDAAHATETDPAQKAARARELADARLKLDLAMERLKRDRARRDAGTPDLCRIPNRMRPVYAARPGLMVLAKSRVPSIRKHSGNADPRCRDHRGGLTGCAAAYVFAAAGHAVTLFEADRIGRLGSGCSSGWLTDDPRPRLPNSMPHWAGALHGMPFRPGVEPR